MGLRKDGPPGGELVVNPRVGPLSAVVFGAEDAARFAILAMRQDAAIARREPAVVSCAHDAHLVVDASVLPLKARGLARVEAAAASAVQDASLLVELALGDGGPLCGLRRGLCDGDGRRGYERRHKCEFRESHGVSLLLWRPCSDQSHWEKHEGAELVFQSKGGDV
jgi:hypothetical protein